MIFIFWRNKVVVGQPIHLYYNITLLESSLSERERNITEFIDSKYFVNIDAFHRILHIV